MSQETSLPNESQAAVLAQPSARSARAILKKQQRTATLVSFIVALLFMVMIMLVLAIIFLAGDSTEKTTLVAYQGRSEAEEEIKVPKVQTKIERKPSSPRIPASKMIVSGSSAPTTVPVPEVQVDEISMEIGIGDDFGESWGNGDGIGQGGGSSFFGQTSNAERIAYVIDYSASMKAEDRDEIMRDELVESLQAMQNGMQIGMVFFAGPAWVAGNDVKMMKGRKEAVVTSEDGEKFKWETKGGAHGWQHDGIKQRVPWWTIDDREVKRLQKIVKKTPLVWGTIWDHPIHLALDMEPAPQTIYFMTDGSASGSAKWAQDVGERAKEMGVIINCVALKQPRAKADLRTIAEMTGGQLTMVNGQGERVKIE